MHTSLFTIDPKTAVGKRLFDVFFASIGLLLSLPLYPLIALAIRLESPGPIFYRQLRIGKAMPERTDLFHMIKFRTMVQMQKNAPARPGPAKPTLVLLG